MPCLFNLKHVWIRVQTVVFQYSLKYWCLYISESPVLYCIIYSYSNIFQICKIGEQHSTLIFYQIGFLLTYSYSYSLLAIGTSTSTGFPVPGVLELVPGTTYYLVPAFTITMRTLYRYRYPLAQNFRFRANLLPVLLLLLVPLQYRYPGTGPLIQPWYLTYWLLTLTADRTGTWAGTGTDYRTIVGNDLLKSEIETAFHISYFIFT